MTEVTLEYIAAGGNRHPSAADWAPGLLAFGAGKNVALWDPDTPSYKGITSLLTGHTDAVDAVKIYDTPSDRCIISGSADKTIRIWRKSLRKAGFEKSQCMEEHHGSINTVSVLPTRDMFVTGSADGILKVWDMSNLQASCTQSISLKPHYLPLTSALIELDEDVVILAVAGTSTSIQLYVREQVGAAFEMQATLVGHEGWIRSLDFVQPSDDDSSNVLLASASQDKYIRLWRFHKNSSLSFGYTNGSLDHSFESMKTSLSNKTHKVGSSEVNYHVTFEALLVGHEDWIYTARWAPQNETSGLKLLTASADNSLAIWQADESSGVWICQTRLGEISAQKGSTTATGSTGGFWIGLWQPSGESVVSLGRTGSWRKWRFDPVIDLWVQQPGISGHTQEVRSAAWAPDGSYLISTGTDQTTRVFARWKTTSGQSWHEFARPQIHGYDLNCVDTLTSSRFISGADEKLLRVFNKPKAIGHLLSRLCGIADDTNGELSEAANIPVLGLSNKAIATTSDEAEQSNGMTEHEIAGQVVVYTPASIHKSALNLDHPPFEEHLSRHTLWPEHEKLYGHGFEISAVASSHDGLLVATACRASSLEHAVIRIYECQEWREVKPALSAHSLTVTALAFSHDDQYLLSVGRDRQWALFTRDSKQSHTFTLLTADLKGHARMILDCSWAPDIVGCVFATAGRDKLVKVWKRSSGDKVKCVTAITELASVTAVAFRNSADYSTFRMALGTENGRVRVLDLHPQSFDVTQNCVLQSDLLPSGAINSLRWRPGNPEDTSRPNQFSVASDDMSLRIFNITP